MVMLGENKLKTLVTIFKIMFLKALPPFTTKKIVLNRGNTRSTPFSKHANVYH